MPNLLCRFEGYVVEKMSLWELEWRAFHPTPVCLSSWPTLYR